MKIDIDKYVQFEYEDIIIEKIKEIGFDKLKPLKESLPDGVSYFDIHYFIIRFKRKNSII